MIGPCRTAHTAATPERRAASSPGPDPATAVHAYPHRRGPHGRNDARYVGVMALRSGRAVEVGELAPDFTLPSQTGGQVSLSDFRGERVVVLYFYPKDETPGCTAEACSFRDSYEAFTEAGAEVVGVSRDSVDSHQRFSGRHRLPFVLLSDVDGEVSQRYGARTLLGLLPGRVTFVIDREGVVRHAFSSSTNIGGHIREALDVVVSLQGDR